MVATQIETTAVTKEQDNMALTFDTFLAVFDAITSR